jgi:hypothetical protein
MNRTNVLIALAGFILLVFGLGCLSFRNIGISSISIFTGHMASAPSKASWYGFNMVVDSSNEIQRGLCGDPWTGFARNYTSEWQIRRAEGAIDGVMGCLS